MFSTLDLKNGFFHVPVDEESRKFTSFITPTAQYEYTKVPFGLCNAPAVFERFIYVIFKERIKDGTILTYMDDLVVLSRDEKEGVSRLKEILATAQDYGLQIQWKKCQFLKRTAKLDYHLQK